MNVIPWNNPENFVSGEYVLVRSMTSEGTFYVCVCLIEDPVIGKDCLCVSLETDKELVIPINDTISMCELE